MDQGKASPGTARETLPAHLAPPRAPTEWLVPNETSWTSRKASTGLKPSIHLHSALRQLASVIRQSSSTASPFLDFLAMCPPAPAGPRLQSVRSDPPRARSRSHVASRGSLKTSGGVSRPSRGEDVYQLAMTSETIDPEKS